MSQTNWTDKKAENNIWLTPNSVLDLVRAYASIVLDPATESSNPTGAAFFFDEATNGLLQSWNKGGLVFVNPPYALTPTAKLISKIPPIRLWAAKIHEEAAKGVEIIALLPCGARFGTKYWQEHILIEQLSCVCFVKGRIKFINGLTGKVGNQTNHDSHICGFNVDVQRFAATIGKLGATFNMKKV